MSQKDKVDADSPENQSSSAGPGLMLTRARKNHGLTIQNIASRLHLSEQIVQALEKEDFSLLPGPVFIQGYLRNYARCVNLSEDEVVASFQRIYPQEETKPQVSHTSGVKKHHAIDFDWLPIVGWTVLIILAVSLVYWLWPSADSELEPAEEPVSQFDPAPMPEEFEGKDPDAVLYIEPSAGSQALDSEETPIVVNEENIPDQALEPQSVTIRQPAPQAGSGAAALPEPLAQEPPEEVQDDISTGVLSDPQLPAASQEIKDQETAAEELIFRFSDSCWTEVRDLNGKAWIIGEMRPGVERRLKKGLGPFKVVLGNAPKVRLTVNGKPYDLTRHTRGRVAKFTLDPENL
jgi:cytoskeleton protein RodZ